MSKPEPGPRGTELVGPFQPLRSGTSPDGARTLRPPPAPPAGSLRWSALSNSLFDAAGVQLYSVAASVMAAAQVAQSEAPGSPELKKRAEEARKAGTVQLSNENVLRGFGTYGGEEHVSYMLTAEAKAALGGTEWAGFRKDIRARLATIQRENGTWRGDHCITSTTFCTAASLITLAIEPRAIGRAS